MSENLKTIKELADELGVSKQGIQYHMKSLPNKDRQKNINGVTVLTLEEQEIIISILLNSNKNKLKRNQADKNQADKNQADKNQADKNQADKNQADKNQADKNQADKNQADKNQADKNQADKNQADIESLIKVQAEQIKDLKEQRIDSKEQLKVKDEQIKSLVEAQKQIQNLLDQQQRLALQDKKLLKEYKAENDSLKAIKMPSQEIEKKQATNQSQEELETLEPQEDPKKWWQFWK